MLYCPGYGLLSLSACKVALVHLFLLLITNAKVLPQVLNLKLDAEFVTFLLDKSAIHVKQWHVQIANFMQQIKSINLHQLEGCVK